MPVDFADALGFVEPAPALPQLTVDLARVEQLSAAVLAHFASHPPDRSSFPAVAMQLLDLVDDPHANPRKLGRLLSGDPALTASVLAVANAAYDGRSQQIDSVGTAVTLLGLREVARLAAGVAGRRHYEDPSLPEMAIFGERFAVLFHRAMTTSYATQYFATARTIGNPDQAFLACLLHSIGRALSLRSLATQIAITQASERDKALPPELIEAVLDRVHVKIGDDVARSWRLPDSLQTLCARIHENPLPDEPDLRELHLLRVVAGIVAARCEGERARRRLPEIEQSARKLGISLVELPSMVDKVGELARQVSTMFDVEEERPPATGP